GARTAEDVCTKSASGERRTGGAATRIQVRMNAAQKQHIMRMRISQEEGCVTPRRASVDFHLAGAVCSEVETSRRRGSQVVRQRSAKPLFSGSNPLRASKIFLASLCRS